MSKKQTEGMMASPDFEEIVEDFEFLDDWEDRYRFVIDMGKAMDPLPDALKAPATKISLNVHFCPSGRPKRKCKESVSHHFTIINFRVIRLKEKPNLL